MTQLIEKHPLEPFLPEDAVFLFLGSFPPKRERWSMNFFYPNWQNDFWRILGLVFFQNKSHFLNEAKKTFQESQIKTFLTQKKIAVYDSAETVLRQKDNASDKFLEIIEPINLTNYLPRLSKCQTIAATGQKAFETTLSQITTFSNVSITQLKIGEFLTFQFQNRTIKLYRMPSSSRAFPMSLENKAALYQKMFLEINLI